MYAEMVTTQEPVLKADALKENTIYLLDSVRGHAIPCIKVGDLLVMLPDKEDVAIARKHISNYVCHSFRLPKAGESYKIQW